MRSVRAIPTYMPGGSDPGCRAILLDQWTVVYHLSKLYYTPEVTAALARCAQEQHFQQAA